MITPNEIIAQQEIARDRQRSIVGFAASSAVIAVALMAIAILISAAAPHNGTASAAPQGTGSIAGKVMFQGTPPERRKLDMSSDPVCTANNFVLAQDGAVSPGGTLPNVFLYLKDVPGTFKPPAEPVVLNQSGCMYFPHVFGVMAGQSLRIVSNDATTHNIHFVSTQNPDWNHSQLPGATPLVNKFAHPEIMIKVHCNEHPWMSAYVAVTSDPFYSVTDENGAFSIQNVPPGEYTLGSWTAAFGTQDQKVTVHAGQTTQVTFTFKAP